MLHFERVDNIKMIKIQYIITFILLNIGLSTIVDESIIEEQCQKLNNSPTTTSHLLAFSNGPPGLLENEGKN